MGIISRIKSAIGLNESSEPPEHEVFEEDSVDSEPDELGTLHPEATEEEIEEAKQTLKEFQEGLEAEAGLKETPDHAVFESDEVPDHPVFGGEPTGQDPDGTVDVASEQAETTTPDHPVFSDD